jgi:hypothetical protein
MIEIKATTDDGRTIYLEKAKEPDGSITYTVTDEDLVVHNIKENEWHRLVLDLVSGKRAAA